MDSIVNWIGNTFQQISETVISVLPKSPFVYIEMIPQVSQVLGVVNYFIPISSMITMAVAWLTCIGSWYIAQAILRWINVVD